jgi:2-polyprenyl-6-methoxyphenol hydroxylase-like FAD-dependent oxidoreductase
MRVLVSGASIAGPVAAYWLTKRGFEVTVVEQAPALRKTGGHAIDLMGPAMDIAERMGVVDRVLAHATGTEHMLVQRIGAARPAYVDYRKVVATLSDRQVEIMRDDLSEILYDAGREDAEYLFGDRITGIGDDGEVTFARNAPRRFDVVIGADGLHSGVRRLVFGEDAGHTEFLGAYLSVVSVPKSLARDRESMGFLDIGRSAMIYTADHLDDARAVFIFRPAGSYEYDHRDTAGQLRTLRRRFTGMAPAVDSWLAELDRTPAFYFDAITQLQLTSWSRGRVSLVGDAGYCPGPAVGGSTSLAVIGAYVLAGELERAGGDHTAAFAAYEQVMTPPVVRARALAKSVAKGILPSSGLGTRALVGLGRLITLLPAPLTSAVASLNDNGIRLYNAVEVPDYPVVCR